MIKSDGVLELLASLLSLRRDPLHCASGDFEYLPILMRFEHQII